MKSREYLNSFNGLIYWLENGAIMMRKPGSHVVRQSEMSATDFFLMVAKDTLTLIEA